MQQIPHMGGSFQQPNSSKQSKKVGRTARFFILVFFVCASGAVFIESPLSKVQTVSVVGAQQVQADQVIKWSGVQKGESIWKVRTEEISQQIKEHLPLVEKVDVSARYFSGHVEIAVAEKSIAAVYISNAKMYRVLNDGTIFDQVDLGSAIDKPIISADKMELVKPGTKLANHQLAILCGQVGKVSPSVLEQVSEVHVSSDNTWTVFMKDGNEVQLPSGTFDSNMKLYPEIQKTIAAKKLPPGMIHVYDGKLVYSPFQTNTSQADTSQTNTSQTNTSQTDTKGN